MSMSNVRDIHENTPVLTLDGNAQYQMFFYDAGGKILHHRALLSLLNVLEDLKYMQETGKIPLKNTVFHHITLIPVRA